MPSEPLKKPLARSRNGDGTSGGGMDLTPAAVTAATLTAASATAAATTARTAVVVAGEAVMTEMLAEFARPDFGLPVLGKAVGLNGEAHPSDSLKDFLLFCKKAYPARHYILFLLGHGLVVGNKMFMLDEHAAPFLPRPDAGRGDPKAKDRGATATPQEEIDVSGSLTLKGLSLALDEFNKAGEDDEDDEDGKEAGELELIGFHSCSMSGLEVAYELQGKAKYMMASQGPAFVGSWPYRQILVQLFNGLNATLRPEDLTDAPALLSKLKDTTEPLARYIRGKFSDAVNKELDESGDPAALLRGLRSVLNDRGLCDAEGVGGIRMKPKTRRLFARAFAARRGQAAAQPAAARRRLPRPNHPEPRRRRRESQKAYQGVLLLRPLQQRRLPTRGLLVRPLPVRPGLSSW